MTTPIESNRSDSTPPDRSINSYAEIWDLHPHFLPVPRRVCDDWDLLARISDEIEALRDTQQSFKVSDVIEKGRGQDSQLVQTFFWALGSYPVEPEICQERWANPNYCHGDEYQNPVHDRDDHLKQATLLPHIRLKDIAPRFNVEAQSLSTYISRNGKEWERKLLDGQRRIGRTIKAAAKWEETDCYEYIEQYPAPSKSVETWVYERAEDFEPPERPTNSNWTEGRV